MQISKCNSKFKINEFWRSQNSLAVIGGCKLSAVNCKLKNGFSLLEIIFVLSIMMLLFVGGTKAFTEMKNKRQLDDSVNRVENLLKEAKSMTTSAVGLYRYGVHFDADKATLFTGDDYLPESVDNKVLDLNNIAFISEISLNGGGQEIIFNKLTGETDQSGSLKVTLHSDSSKFRVISVSPLGVVEAN